MYASEGGHAEVVKLLLKAGARVDLQADNGFTAKDLAKWRRHVDVVKVLKDPAEVSSTITSIPDVGIFAHAQVLGVIFGPPTGNRL